MTSMRNYWFQATSALTRRRARTKALGSMKTTQQSCLSPVLLVAACAFGIANAQVVDNRKYLIDPATAAINGIRINSTESDIIRRLGKPKSVESSFSEVVSKPSKYLYYDGMKIYLIEGNIYNCLCTGKKCQTERGVRVGDNKAKVTDVYGPGNPPHSGSKRDTLSYPLKGIDSYLVFLFKNGTVVEIMFWVDYV